MQSSCYNHETDEAARLAGPRVPPKLPPKVSRRLTERPGASTSESAAAKAKKAPPLPAQPPRSTSVVPCTSSHSQQPPHHQVQQSDSLVSLSPPPPAPVNPKGTHKLHSPGLIPHELPARPSDPGTPRLGASRRRRGMMPPPPLVSSPSPSTSTSALTPRSSLPGNTSRLSSPQDSENHAPASKAVENMPLLQLPARPSTRPDRGSLSMTGELNISHDAGLVIETNSKTSFRPGASSLPPTPRAGIMTPIVRSPQARELGGSFSTSSASSTFSLESHTPANAREKANEISMPNTSGGPGRAQVEKKTLVRARVSYDSSLPEHLSFEAGQIIELLQQKEDIHDDDGHALWKGRAIIGGREHVGIFPSVHVALMKSRLNSLGNADFAAAGLPSKKELRILNKDCISPENLERETRCDKLFRAIEEVIETELRHVSDLSIVLEVFIMPFQDTFGPLLARQVFSDWAPLLRVHEQVLVNLMATLPSIEQLAKGFESVGNDPNVQLALRDDTNQGPAKQPRGARVGLAPSNLAAFAEGVNQAARLGVARKPLGADSGTPSAATKSTAQQRGQDFLSAKDMNAMKQRLSFLSKLRREHLADFLYLDDAQVTRWTLILHEMTISVCRVMTEMSDWLKLCIPCVVNQPVAMKTLLRSKGGNGATVSPKMFIQLQAHQERERLKHLDLASFLIKPMQRITKYPLLMREIRKYCEADSKAQSDASDATETMTRIATNVNDIMKQHQNLDYSKRLIEICTQLRPRETVERLGLGADSRGRRLYRFGRVTFQTLTTSMNSSQLTHEDDSHMPAAQLSKTEEIRHGSCYAMLFTSALLLSLKALNKWKTKTKFHIVKVVELGHIVSVESMDGCLAVRTACSLLLITPLEGDVLEWLVDMQECRRVAAADRERQDVVNAQRKKRQGSSGRAMTRRTRSEDLSKLVRGPLQSLRGAPSRELTKAERDNIICELKTHAKFSTAS